ncbi:MAG TPA: MFS transporter [Hyphomonadaceae bacterium]
MTEIAQSPPSAAPDAGAPGRTLFISALGVGQICSWGSLYYAFPLIAEQIERETGWARTSLYGAATVGLLFAALASFPIGRAIDRGHGRLIMTGGAVLAGLLLLAWSQVEDLLGLYAIVGLLGALQAATLYESAFAVVARRFGAGDARGAIIALTLWGGFASTVFIPLIQLLIDLWGWRGALTALGLINLLLCAGLYGWAIRPSADKPQPHAAGAAPASSRITTAMASPVFWTLALAFTAHAAAFTAFTFHLYPLLLERGFSTSAVVAAMALIGPAQVGGRIAVTMFAARASMRRIGSWVVVGFPLGFAALVWLPPSFILIMAVTILYGAANGILTIVRGAAVPEMLTQQNYGAVSGAMNTPATVARALSPLAAAALWSLSGSYDPVLLAILAGAVLLAAGFWSAALLSRRVVVS